MIDDEFVMKLIELDAKGKDGLVDAREVLKTCGGMKRLLAIALRGLGGRPKAAGRVSTATKTRLPDEFPGETEKSAAVTYWQRKRRPDLVANVEEEAEKFVSHHLGAGTRSENWSASWRTWYSHALEFNKPPRDGGLFQVAETVFEQCNVAGWVGRIRAYYDSESRVWPARWGGKPPENPEDAIPSGCRCPSQAFAQYLAEKKRRGGSAALA